MAKDIINIIIENCSMFPKGLRIFYKLIQT